MAIEINFLVVFLIYGKKEAGLQHQWLFYADYIIKKKDGSIWVIEIKGGEARGQDKKIENKFNAFKQYAQAKNLNWGFVRDKDGELLM